MKLYNTRQGIVLERERSLYRLQGHDWHTLVNRSQLHAYLTTLAGSDLPVLEGTATAFADHDLLAPIGAGQEVWAAGVTYLKSRDARMEESKSSGGASMYDKVYDAERPEIFFKALPHRVAGHKGQVNIRRDSTWNVPEPELTLFINSAGEIQGYTVGNDMSSRSIEGENPLYLPQAKIYERSAALGPCLYVPAEPIPANTVISMQIMRDEKTAYEDSVSIDRMKRTLTELAGFLYRECDFPAGCYLMTGTCLVPDPSFTLRAGDVVHIRISGIGTLTNTIGLKNS